MKSVVPGTALFVYLLAMAAAGSAGAAERSSVTLHEGWTFRQAGREESYPAKVPGVVHLDLFQNGLLAGRSRPYPGPLTREQVEWKPPGGGLCQMAPRKPNCS